MKIKPSNNIKFVFIILAIILGRIKAITFYGLMNVASIKLIHASSDYESLWKVDCRQQNGIDSGEIAGVITDMYPLNPEAWLLRGHTAWLSGNCSEAIHYFQQAVDLSSDVKKKIAVIFLSVVFFQTGRDDKAVELLMEYELGIYLNNLAFSMEEFGKLQYASEIYLLALKVEPTEANAQSLVSIYASLGHPEWSMQVWQEVEQNADIGKGVYWFAKAELDIANHDWLQAGEDLEQSIVRSTDPYLAYIRLGDVLTKLQKYDGAITAYQYAIDRRPKNTHIPYTKAGEVELLRGRYEQAMIWFDKAARVFPQDAWPEIIAGNAAMDHKDYTEAEKRYMQALKKTPNQYMALHQLALLKHQMGEISEGIMYLEKVEKMGTNCNVMNMLRDWYTEAGNFTESQEIQMRIQITCP